jgi:hypothetical protein
MDGEVAVLGCMDYLDIWNDERFRTRIEGDPFTTEDEQSLGDLGV